MSERDAKTNPPRPREGMLGVWDRVVGPGAARWEMAGTVGFAAAAALLAPILLQRQRPAASSLELAVASAIGKDLGGGVWRAETPSSKQWHYRPESGRLARVGIAAAQVHPVLAEAASGRGQWRSAVIAHSTLVAGAALLELTPAERRRSTAISLYAAWLGAILVAAPPPPGYAWMPALLGYKQLVGEGTPRGPLSALRRRRRALRG